MPTIDAFYENADRITADVTAAGIPGGRLVTVTAARASGPAIPATAQIGASDPTDGGNIKVGYPTAGQHALGATAYDTVNIGDKVTVIRAGVLPLMAVANITAGNRVMVGASGQVTPYVVAGALPDNVVVGIAVDTYLAGALGGIALLTE